MKIKDIYLSKNKCVVSIVIAILCICVTTVSFIIPSTYTALAYSYPIKYPWQIISGLFLHGSPELSTIGCVGHLIFNLLLVLPFGIMIEKILGSKRFLIVSLILWVVNIATFYVLAITSTPAGETSYGAGISGVAFSYGVMGLYVLIRLFIYTKVKIFKQVSFYLLLNIILIMLIMINPIVAGVSSMIIHIVAVVTGVIITLILRKSIDLFLQGKETITV